MSGIIIILGFLMTISVFLMKIIILVTMTLLLVVVECDSPYRNSLLLAEPKEVMAPINNEEYGEGMEGRAET